MRPPTGPPGASRFHTTRWSVVLAAGRITAESSAALEELCAVYWRPIYGFIRRRGHSSEQARDLTQGFFARFLERRDVGAVDPSRGRFRSYLLAAVKNFLANERERELALKRGAAQFPSRSRSTTARISASIRSTRARPRTTSSVSGRWRSCAVRWNAFGTSRPPGDGARSSSA